MNRGKVFVNFFAQGALDQSSSAGPRDNPAVNIWAAENKPAGVAGRIRYAPMADNACFFQKYRKQMVVINGVHSETISHFVG